ncbi:hypothetical protein SO486_16620 [Pseudomonas salmasensis]|uniref:Uncharacterized protein n=1 Tax=Pseudomonas salmasensis TaxID=2745514 RepID=A0ABU5FHN1_9PSED|nr:MULTISPECIES: hypothetical protein [Pseudomonas]MCF5509071.1 hypothetical protein [Pseudomonas sp. PA-3-6H]MCF5517065.1 hypothetical protein [Pseudomonas sp. PA-3-6E]MCF5564360.1 hypothetical protein [Pseudomonas sp. PA-3-5D]MCF5568229.1 hypothetical protein [Pseudomonas sp. PA-3-11C]MCF5594913.1 hypothetical protein [Pseudomonas sp. PA-3-10C]
MDFNTLFRLLLTFNATSLLVIVYMVQREITFGGFIADPSLPGLKTAISGLSYALYLAVPIVLTGLSLRLSRRLGSDTFQPGQVVSIEHANNSFLPSYLGYFFVALSINSFQTLVFVYLILFIFTYRSQALYFNPLFLLYGYEFYNVSTSSHVTLFLISKESFRTPKEVVIDKVYRINDYTLIDRG